MAKTSNRLALLRISDDLQGRLDRVPRRYPDSARRRSMRSALEIARGHLVKRVKKLAAQVSAKQMSQNDAVELLRGVTLDAVLSSYTFGLTFAGVGHVELDDEQLDHLNELVEADMRAARRFFRTLGESMDPEDRATLYGGIVEDAMWRGWVDGLPSGSVIHWRLGIAEHCDDCLSLALRSPFSKPGSGAGDELPTVPRAGETRCLSNCRCSLWTESLPLQSAALTVNAEVIELGGQLIDPMSPTAMNLARGYRGMVELYAYYRRMFAATGEASWRRQADLIRDEINRQAEIARQRVQLSFTDDEIEAAVRRATDQGLRFIAPAQLDDFLLLAVATGLAIEHVDRGTIESFSLAPPSVGVATGRGPRIWRLDEFGRILLFIENQD